MPEFALLLVHLPIAFLAYAIIYRLRSYWAVRDERPLDRVDQLSEGQDVLLAGTIVIDDEDTLECPPTEERCIYYHWQMRRHVPSVVPGTEIHHRRQIETSNATRSVRRFILSTEHGDIAVVTSAAEWLTDPSQPGAQSAAAAIIAPFVPGECLELIPADAEIRVAGRVREMGDQLEIKSSLDHPAVITNAPPGQLRRALFRPYAFGLVILTLMSASALSTYFIQGRDAYGDSWKDPQAKQKLLRRR